MKKIFSTLAQINLNGFIFVMLFPALSFGQYPGAVGQTSSNAIAKDSSIIVGWANECVVTRGFVNITSPSLGLASFGSDSDATGPANQMHVVSLGDSGVAVLSFPHPIFNGSGPDFVVFENSFNDSFLELGHVEVSSDGINFYRFPSEFLAQSSIQIGPFDQQGEPEKINNLAGKYRGGFGTPFDLNELNGIAGLDINAVTHVKIVDVIGSIDLNSASFDQNNNPINDPFPTAFESGGFDLDAVGVCHMQFVNGLNEYKNDMISVFPNPVISELNIGVQSSAIQNIEIYSTQGLLVERTTASKINIGQLAPGIYHLKIMLINGQSFSKRIIKR